VQRFAALLDRLALTPSRLGKLAVLRDYFAATPDPDRGWALAALGGGLDLPAVRPAMLRALAESRTDPELFRLSYDYVGDLGETVALIWADARDPEGPVPTLGAVVARLRALSRETAPEVIASYLDAMPAPERLALIKLATGGLRVGVSARLARQALAEWGAVPVGEIEELWHGLAPPYEPLFAWLERRGPKPEQTDPLPFRPVMLAHPVGPGDLDRLDPADYLVEWKWDGIRVQAAATGMVRRLSSRSGDDISAAFPDLLAAMAFDGVLDGELLVLDGVGGPIAGFAELQGRLNRKRASPRLMDRHPAMLMAYDLLIEGGEDLRARPFAERRARLDAFLAPLDAGRFGLSELLPVAGWEEIATRRATPSHPAIEGVMLKRRDSPYLPGRPRGPWFKWKRDPFTIDAVLLYAARGHGRRSSLYSDYTFGLWTDAGALVPVGKAYFGFTDAELARIDRFVRENTVERFGPVRAVRAGPDAGLVLEIAFEGVRRSTRHKSGLALRFPRVSRLRWDKPPGEADRLCRLEALLAAGTGEDRTGLR